jgi:hypothetical protein
MKRLSPLKLLQRLLQGLKPSFGFAAGLKDPDFLRTCYCAEILDGRSLADFSLRFKRAKCRCCGM